MHTPAPGPIIIFVPTPSMGQVVPRRGLPPWPAPKPSKLPRRRPAPIPTFDRRALRERVTHLLNHTRPQRDALKAASNSCLWAQEAA
jgi:hypothetical protein